MVNPARNKLKHWQMRLFWVIFKHCARRALGLESEKYDDDLALVIEMPIASYLRPLFFSYFQLRSFFSFFLQEETIEPLLSIMDDDHRSQVDENYYSLLGMKYEKYGGGKEAADQKEKWCYAPTQCLVTSKKKYAHSQC